MSYATLPALIALYGACYVPFAALSKIAGGRHGPSGILLGSVLSSAIVWAIVCTTLGWWGRVKRGLTGASLLAGLASVAILVASVVMYGEPRLSVVLPALLTKGGVLLLSPAIDRWKRRPVRPAHVATLALAALAVVVGFAPHMGAESSAVALVCAAVYLLGYGLKLPAMESGKRERGLDFLCAEMTVTSLTAVALCLPLLRISGHAAAGLADPVVLLSGVVSCGCGFFGGLMLLYRDTCTRLVPVSKAVGLIAGVIASVCLGKIPGVPEIAGVALMTGALWLGTREA